MSLRARLFAYFMAAFLILAIVIGGAFTVLMNRHNASVYEDEYGRWAEGVAAAMGNAATAATADATTTQGGGHGPGQGGGNGMGAYRRFIEQVAGADAWAFDASGTELEWAQGHGHGDASTSPPATDDARAMAMEAVATGASVTTSAGLLSPEVTAAAPIVAADGTVTGAVVVHSHVGTVRAVTQGGLVVLGASTLLALAIAGIAAFALAGRFTAPLGQLRAAAARIGHGDYAPTGLSGTDEIGQLAGSMDSMAASLAAAEQERSAAEQSRKDFLSSVSHELRTPVTVMRGSLEALIDGVVDEPADGPYHRQLLAETTQLERLVNDVLELSRLDNPDFQMETGPVAVSDVVSDAVRSLRPLASSRDISVSVDDSAEGALVNADYGRLRQLLVVLIDNALKFSPDASTIELAARADATTAIVTVRDHGPGIAPDVLPRVFERFQKTDGAGNEDGVGLGLAIAHRIAERHGGMLQAANAPDGGAILTLVLPLSGPPRASP